MTYNMSIQKILILVAQLFLCLLLSAAPALSDRDVGPPHHEYFQRLREKKASKTQYFSKPQTKYSQGDDDESATVIKIRPKTRNLLLYRSFLLAAVFWVARFVGPQIIKWLGRMCKDISDFKRFTSRAKEMRRRRKKKSHHDPEAGGTPSAASETSSVSPSIMEMIDSGDSDDDSCSVASTSTFSSVTTFFRSFGATRRRSSRTSTAVAPDREASHTSSTRRLKSRFSRTKHAKSPTGQRYGDGESGEEDTILRNSWQSKLPKFLRFIDEDDNINNGAVDKKLQKSNDSNEHRNRRNHNNQWLDDVSHIPTAGNARIDHGYNPTSRRKPRGSQSERNSSDSDIFDSGHSDREDSRQEKHASSKSHRHQGHHRHRDRKK